MVGGGVEFPVPVTEHAVVRPGAHHFANEKVVGLLVVRLGDDAAPGGQRSLWRQWWAVFQRAHRSVRAHRTAPWWRCSLSGWVWALSSGASVSAAWARWAVAGRSGRWPRPARARVRVALSSTTVTIGGLGVQRAGPGGGHHIGLAAVRRRHQHGGPWFEQPVGLVEQRRGEVDGTRAWFASGGGRGEIGGLRPEQVLRPGGW